MNEHELIAAANHVTTQRLLARFFSTSDRYATREIAGAVITVEPSRRRTGIPDDAICARCVVTHPVDGWSVVARTVWRNGSLIEPAAVHTAIDHYLADDDRHGGPAEVARAYNGWLMTLDL